MHKISSRRQIVLLTLALLCIVGLIAGVSALSGAYSDDTPGKALGEILPITTESARSATSGETLISTLPSTYDTYTYTHSDLLIFSYTDGTQFEVYNSASSLVWSGTVNAGGHNGLTTGAGTYKIKGTNPYSVLTGDELTSYVMGYYAFDKDGKGLSTLIYTYQVNTNSWSSANYSNFIVFAYEDSTSVAISNTVTGAPIWNGTLNTGQHHAEPTLSNVYITVTASKPVSALSYTDQGYYIPASSGTFMGKKFYSWAGTAGGWTEDLNIIAYSDSTTATVTNTETGALIWSGTLNAGGVKSIPFTSAQYLTVTTDKDVNAGIFPYLSFNSYYYSVHAQDTSGTGIGTLFYFPAIPGGKMVIFAFTNNTLVTVTNSAGGAVWSGYLNNGESHQLTPSTKDVYKIVGTNLMSVVYDYGDSAGADFAPQYYATPTTPTVTLNTPNGGETWTVGTGQNITWVASGGTGSLSASLYYSTTGLTGTYTQIATGLQNTGSYTWTVPNTPSTTAAVKIVVTDSAGNVATDTSNAVFTINSAATDQLILTINQIDNSSFGTITTFVTVTNQDGTSITGLTASNFAVSEGSSCTPSITVTPVSSTGKPVSIPMCVDYSGSMSAADIASAKTGLKNFINMSATNDRFAILKFATTVEIVQALTSDKTLLLSKVNSMSDYSGGNTALYDSIYDAVTLAKSESYRKAVIAFTDGNSNSDVHSLTETIAYAKANGVPVYTIGLGSVNPSVLQQIANQTGGQYYYAPTSDQLTNIYSQISQSLANQYQITYQTCNPTRDGTYREVTVTATYSGLTGTDTRGYYAPSQAVGSVTVTSVTPTSGPVGTTVSISGTGFVSGATVKIGTVDATSSVISSNAISAVVPTLSAGTYDVKVTNPDGGFGTLANGFTVTGGVGPIVNFVGTPTSGTAPLTVTFTDLSTGMLTYSSAQNQQASGSGLTTKTILAQGTSAAIAGATGNELHAAPINPDFIKYMKEKPYDSQVQGGTQGLGLIPSPIYRPEVRDVQMFGPNVGDRSSSYPATFDLRTSGKVSPVKNQNPFGTCWAFATFASLESTLMPVTPTPDFSEKNLANLAGFDYAIPEGGGQMWMSTAYLTRWNGPVNEATDPYPTSTWTTSSTYPPVKHIQNVVFFPGRTSRTDNDNIKGALTQWGAVYSSLFWDDSFYNAAYTSYYQPASAANPSTGGGHAVTIVGWDDTYVATNFNTAADGPGAWIVKNSWGTGWGTNGYFYVSYYDKYFGSVIESGTSKDTAVFRGESTSNYDTVYSYDTLGEVTDYYYGTVKTGSFANVFTATSSGTLKAVGFYTTDVNVLSTINIYKNPTSGPVGGTPVATFSTTLPTMGYNTVEIPSSQQVSVTTGDRLSVVVQVTNPTNSYYIPIEMNSAGYTSGIVSQSGQGYLLGSTGWTDLKTIMDNSHVCVKAYTSSTTPSPTSWSWNFGDSSSVNATMQNPVHTYASAGTYTVSLTATNSAGSNTSTRTNYITVTSPTGNSTLRGFVFDSVTGLKVPGATISIAGLTTTSDSNGNYTVTGIPPGVLDAEFTGSPRSGLAPLTVSFNDLSVTNANILTVTKTGYYTFTNNGISIEPGQTLQYDVAITPELSPGGGEYRIVLTWAENPRDLDAHLNTPIIEGQTYHIYYANKGSMSSPPYAILDIDDQYSYGPETVTINRTFSGTYNYYVYNYAGTGSLSTSNAQVVVYSGSSLVATYRVPTTGTGRYWQVFNLAGATGVITSINTIADAPQSSTSSASSLDSATYPEKPAVTPDRQFICPPGLGFSGERFAVKSLSVDPILTWSWNFGDGTTAITQNPNHTYSNTGSYAVSLTITNSQGTNTETKANYITVTSTRPAESNVGVFRDGVFYLNGAGYTVYGLSTDTPVIGDWNGDLISEVGVYRGGVFYRKGADAVVYGLSTDTPIIGDWNGDLKSEVGVFRGGVFYRNGADPIVFGLPTDIPVIGDWNGDLISEVGVYRGGVFYLNGAGYTVYGLSTDIPVIGDWNGDGLSEVGVFRDGVFYRNGAEAIVYGISTDTPVTGKWTV